MVVPLDDLRRQLGAALSHHDLPARLREPDAPTAEPAPGRVIVSAKNTMMLVTCAAGLVAALAGIAGLVWHWQVSTRVEVAIPVIAAAPDRASVTTPVSVAGVLQASAIVTVGGDVSGRVEEILVAIDSPVAKGQTIAKLDSRRLERTLDQVRADYAVAKSNLTMASVKRAELDRHLERAKSEADLTERSLEEARADARGEQRVARATVTAAAASLEQARVALRQAEADLAACIIVSPIDGILVSRSVEVGQTISSSEDGQRPFSLAANPQTLKLVTTIANADAPRLQPGMHVDVVPAARPDDRHSGTLRQLRIVAGSSSSNISYQAVVEVANQDLSLRPGMLAHVAFVNR